MNKTELIIENKDQWIKALKKTIRRYEKELVGDYSDQYEQCTLCLLAYKVKIMIQQEKYPSGGTCTYCIHKSTLGAGIICLDQKSFKNVFLLTSNAVTDKRLARDIRYRITYLKKMIIKLKAL